LTSSSEYRATADFLLILVRPWDISVSTGIVVQRKKGLMQLSEGKDINKLAEHVLEGAERAFGDIEFARKWMTLPNPVLGGEAPLDRARTVAGAREVTAMLSSFAHGDYL
jgi:uncharacterized protein (DUF2384 family)